MPKTETRFIALLAFFVLITGLFFPYLQGSDANEYASIATQMFLRNDWVNIVNHHPTTGQIYDYLDKPHLLFWSAMVGYKLFGIHDFSYRFISVLMTVAAVFATYRMGRLLYSETVGKMSAVFFVTAQAIILANHDVKTDTLLVSFVALATWQLLEFIHSNRWQNALWAGAFLAGGVGTKGMIAVLVVGCVIFFYLLGRRRWKLFFSWKWLVFIAGFFLFLSPVLYCYWRQFDLHPEKFVNGSYNQSGIRFLLWSQSFERFAGDRKYVLYPEFSFLFHTFLWAFLPWALLTYIGVFHRLKELVQTRGASFFRREQLSFAGVWVMFIIISLSKFKLPHYVNVLFPVFAVFTAGFLFQLYSEHRDKFLKAVATLQWVIVAVLLLLLVALNVWGFPAHFILLLFAAAGIVYIFYLAVKPKGNLLFRAWYPSAIAALLLNILLNTNFYPQSQLYQGGMMVAKQMLQDAVDWSNVYNYKIITRWFDFYSRHWQPVVDDNGIRELQRLGKPVYLYVNDYLKVELDKSFTTRIIYQRPDFEVAGLTTKFINPKTRPSVIGVVYLVVVL